MLTYFICLCAGIPEPYRPKNRFDVIRWDYFTETHIFFQDDFTNVKELLGIMLVFKTCNRQICVFYYVICLLDDNGSLHWNFHSVSFTDPLVKTLNHPLAMGNHTPKMHTKCLIYLFSILELENLYLSVPKKK